MKQNTPRNRTQQLVCTLGKLKLNYIEVRAKIDT